MEAGGARVLHASRWKQAGGGGGAAVDLVVCSKEAAAPLDATAAALVKGGALAVGPLYVVEWLAKPKGSLTAHTIKGCARRAVGWLWRGRGPPPPLLLPRPCIFDARAPAPYCPLLCSQPSAALKAAVAARATMKAAPLRAAAAEEDADEQGGESDEEASLVL